MCLEIPSLTVSKYLTKLRDMGYVKDERQEQFMFYCLDNNGKVLKAILQDIIDNLETYTTLEKDLKQLDNAERFIEAFKIR